jgi:hypothetical protein
LPLLPQADTPIAGWQSRQNRYAARRAEKNDREIAALAAGEFDAGPG